MWAVRSLPTPLVYDLVWQKREGQMMPTVSPVPIRKIRRFGDGWQNGFAEICSACEQQG